MNCSETYTVIYEVTPLPTANVVITGNNPYCPNDPPTLSVSGGPYSQITWVPSGSNLPTLTPFQTGSYYAFINDTNFCPGETDTVFLTEQNVPPVQFSSQSSGLTSQFTSGDQNAVTWNWDFGDGNTSTLENPAHTYAAPGTYTVCLGVSYLITGCQDTLCQSVQIGATGIAGPEEADIAVYPNPSSGLLRISGPGIQYFELTDLRGKMLHSEQVSLGSDQAKADLRELPQGVYLLKIFTPAGVLSRKVIKTE